MSESSDDVPLIARAGATKVNGTSTPASNPLKRPDPPRKASEPAARSQLGGASQSAANAKSSQPAAAPTGPVKESTSDLPNVDSKSSQQAKGGSEPVKASARTSGGSGAEKAETASSKSKAPAAKQTKGKAADKAPAKEDSDKADEAGGAKKAKDKAPPKPKVEYELPGQTRPTPEPTEPLRKFYSSLLEQRPKSDMAHRWLIMHGLLSADVAKKWLEANGKKVSTSTPVKARQASQSSEPRRAPPKKNHPPANGDKVKAQTRAPSAPRKRSKKVESEDDEDGDEDEEQLPVSKRAKSSAPAANGSAKAATTKSAPTKKAPAKSATVKRAVLDSDSDSDEEVPLAQLKR